MAERCNTVLPKICPRDEEDFHAAMMEAVSRQIGRHGKAKVALAMALSIRQLDNLGAGSFPRPDRLYNLLTLDADALDPMDRIYERRAVPRDAVCSTDPVSTKLAMLLARTIDIEREDSDGGAEATMRELFTIDEPALRAVANKLNGWIERLDAYRAGEEPKLRVA